MNIHRHFRSIRIALFGLIFITVLPALGIIVYSWLDRQHSDIERAQDDTLQILRAVAASHESTVEGTRQFLSTLARLPDVQNRNAPACNRIFRELHKANPLYSSIVAADDEGMVFANAAPFTPYSVKHIKYFQDVLRTKGFSAGEYTIGTISRLPVIHFGHPVIDSRDKIRAVLSVGIRLDLYDSIVIGTKLVKGSVFALTDHRHIRLNGYPIRDNFAGKPDNPELIKKMSAQAAEGTFTAIDGDGIKRLYAYKRFYLKDSGSPYLFMRVGIPEEKALSGARKNMALNTALLFFAIIIISISAWHFGNTLVIRKLNKLIDASRKLKGGDLSARTGIEHSPHSPDELGELAKVFDEMAEGLEVKESRHRRTEQNLKESEEKYRSLIEMTPDLVFMVNRQGMFTYINPVFEKVTGYGTEELLGKPFTVIIAPGLRQSTVERFRKGIRDEAMPAYETTIVSKEGVGITMEFLVSTLHDKDGKPTGRFGIGRDITERMKTQEDLRVAAELYRTLATHSQVAIYIVQDGRIRFTNPYLPQYSGYGVADLVGMNVLNFVHPEDREMVRKKAASMLKGESSAPYEFRIIDNSGKIRWLVETISPITFRGKRATLGHTMDITKQKEMAQQLEKTKEMLLQSDKLAAVGRLSAGVAHEILNPVNIMSIRLQMLEMTETLSDKARETMDICHDQIERVVKITKGLNEFSRADLPKLSVSNINRIIERVLAFAGPRLKMEDIEVDIQFQTDILSVSLDKNRLEQVILNIINNAVDAMRGRNNRTLIIRTEKTNTSDRRQAVQVTFADTGTGVPPENITRIFDPFFTTKDPDKGTGLGLSVCYGIIQDHGGKIRAESNEWGGTTFVIELPLGDPGFNNTAE